MGDIHKGHVRYPEFRRAGTFDGSAGLPAACWLKQYKWDWRTVLGDAEIPPESYANSLSVCLQGDAAECAETTPSIPTLL